MWRAFPAGDVVRVCACFRDLTWLVVGPAVAALVDQLGWTVVETDERFIRADTGWQISRPQASFSLRKGSITGVSFELMDVVQRPDPAAADALTDVFADAVREGTDALGAPATSRSRGESRARWELRNGGRITVSADDAGVAVDIGSAEFAEAQRILAW